MKYREYDGKRRDRADERREPGRDRAGKKYEFGRNGAGEKCELGRDRASKKYEFGRGRADEKYESGRDRAGEKYEFGRKRANERREPGRAGMHSYGEPGYPVGEEICEESSRIVEGRNAVIEAFRSGREIDRVLILDGCQDGPIQTIRREAKKHGTVVDFVKKERLEQLSVTGMHQGVIAYAAACEYSTVEAILDSAKAKGEPPFLFLLDNIEDPHNLGAIIRTANLVGAHGVIIPKRRAVGLTATVARTSAGALNYTPVARVTNLGNTIEELKKEGIWFVCADMGAEPMYRQNLTGPIGLVIGNEGEGVSRLVKEKCDFIASIPMKGNIDSLNASVAAGVLAYEILRQRDFKGV